MACELILQRISQCILSYSFHFIQLFYFSVFHSILFYPIPSYSFFILFHSRPSFFFSFRLLRILLCYLTHFCPLITLQTVNNYHSLGEACSLAYRTSSLDEQNIPVLLFKMKSVFFTVGKVFFSVFFFNFFINNSCLENYQVMVEP